MNGEKSEQILEAIEDARVYSLQKKHGKKIITLGNPRSDSKDLENLFMDKERKDDRTMSDNLKYTVQLDEEAVKEIKDQVFRDFRDRWDIINKENIELKREIQELKDENEKLIKMGIDLSSWICTLANYSGDARNRLKDNVWFEGVKQNYISEVRYGGNK